MAELPQVEDFTVTRPDPLVLAGARAFVERMCPVDAPTMLEALGFASYMGKANDRWSGRTDDVVRDGWTS